MLLNHEDCLIPCKGIYADVVKDIEIKEIDKMNKFDNLVDAYERYKRGYILDIKYPSVLKGRNSNI